MGRRSPQAQLLAMKEKYPQFISKKMPDGTIIWRGLVQPILSPYEIIVMWSLREKTPYVGVVTPSLEPRIDGNYEDIPHLLFDDKNPKLSGLCLFDPESNEWTHEDLIAETTIPWACEWLMYYELWHLDGVWRGQSVGYESIGEIRRLLGNESEQETEKCLQKDVPTPAGLAD